MFADLLKYTFSADKLIIDVFEKADNALPEAELLFSHILNAQHIWISRILNKPHVFDRFDRHNVKEFRALQLENETQLLHILNGFNPDQIITYFNIKDKQKFESRLSDILFHIVNHSTYHRGQVATQFRLNQIDPPITDYVFLKREGLI